MYIYNINVWLGKGACSVAYQCLECSPSTSRWKQGLRRRDIQGTASLHFDLQMGSAKNVVFFSKYGRPLDSLKLSGLYNMSSVPLAFVPTPWPQVQTNLTTLYIHNIYIYIHNIIYICIYVILYYIILYYIILYHIILHYIILHIYIYIYLVKRVKVGWQFFRGLAILDAAPLRWTKSGWQRWTFGEHHDHKLFGRWLWINTYDNTIFRGLWTSIYPSYFDVNYRGTRFWPTARWRGRIRRSVLKRALNKWRRPPCV